MARGTRVTLMAALAIFGMAATACGGGVKTTVNATLTDTAIEMDKSSVPAGEVTFVAENTGTEAHELVVLKTDLAADALPVAGGKVQEDAEGIEEIGEIEEFAAGGSETDSFGLEPGSYVLVCNVKGHYEDGMTTAFTVTEAPES